MDSFKLSPRTPYSQAVSFLEPLVGRTIMIHRGGQGVHARGRIMGQLLRVEAVTATSYHGSPLVVLASRFEIGKEIKVQLAEIVQLDLRD